MSESLFALPRLRAEHDNFDGLLEFLHQAFADLSGKLQGAHPGLVFLHDAIINQARIFLRDLPGSKRP